MNEARAKLLLDCMQPRRRHESFRLYSAVLSCRHAGYRVHRAGNNLVRVHGVNDNHRRVGGQLLAHKEFLAFAATI